MKVIYVAGKYSAKCDWELYNNIHKARVVAHRLWKEGWAVICPHSNNAFFSEDNESEEWKTYMAGLLAILGRCDAIYMMKDWEESKGAPIELREAQALGLEIIYEPES